MTAQHTPDKGETWYCKLPNYTTLSEVVVKDVTAHTVELVTLGGNRQRYCTEDVEFIEKVHKQF